MPRLRLRRASAAEPTSGTSEDPSDDLTDDLTEDAPGSLPDVLVMTMARDEADMLPRWIRHYAGQVGMEHLLILDDNSTDGSTDDLECTVHRLPPLRFSGGRFEPIRMQLLSGLAQGFLATYDVVVFVDVDEFLVADPARHRNLRSFLATREDREVIAPVGLNIVHLPQVEGPLRPDEPVLGQRRFAQFTPLMCKPSLKRIPAGWRWASHGIEAPFEVDPELFMVHLKFADRDALRRVAAHRKAMVDADGRARKSSWSKDADHVLAVFDHRVADVDPDEVPELDVSGLDLSAVVERKDGWYRAVGRGQLPAIRHEPLVRVPSRLLGTV
jgi:hypothetical protein